MKKILCIALALLMILSLCACGKKSAEEEEGPNAVGTLPIPFDDPNNLQEAMIPAEFKADGLKMAEDGTYTLDADIYVQVMYDAVDVSRMKKGDRFFDADGNEMTVSSIKSEDSLLLVNGGLDEGGVTLFSVGGGVYMQVNEDGFVAVFNTGAATYPVSPDFTLVDNADPGNPDVTVPLAELADYLAADTIGFTPNNTTLEIADAQITGVTRNCVP